MSVNSGSSVSIAPFSQVRGANGEVTSSNITTTELTGLSGATAAATNLIPAGALVLGVTHRVTTLITGATSWDSGDGTTADAFGNNVAVSANTTADSLVDGTFTAPKSYAAATDVVLTAVGSNFTAGAVRISVHYIDLTPPTV